MISISVVAVLSRRQRGTALVTGGPQRGAVVLADTHIGLLPGAGVVPHLWPDDGCARCSCLLEEVERAPDDIPLASFVPWAATGVSEREISGQEARYAAVLDDVARRADDHSRNARRFERPCDQTHGLVADGSERNEQRNVNAVFATAGHDRRRVLLDGAALRVLGRCAVEMRPQRAEPACRDQALKLTHWQIGLAIVGMGSAIVLGEVTGPELFGGTPEITDRHSAPAPAVARVRHGRGDDRDDGLGELLAKRVEWYVVVMSPVIGFGVALSCVVVARALHVTYRVFIIHGQSSNSV